MYLAIFILQVTGKDIAAITSGLGEGEILNSILHVLPDVKLVSIYGGLWWWCEDDILNGRSCEGYKLEEGTGKFISKGCGGIIKSTHYI